MILHALALGARDLFGVLLVFLIFDLCVYGLVCVARWLAGRADARYLAEVERERERTRTRLRMHERRRSEMRCYGNARPTAAERWDRGTA